MALSLQSSNENLHAITQSQRWILIDGVPAVVEKRASALTTSYRYGLQLLAIERNVKVHVQ